MRTRVLWFLCIAAFAIGASADRFVDLANEPQARAIFADVLARGGNGERQIESAAFMVVDDHDDFGCLVWPMTGLRLKQVFIGPPPDSTKAIVHTHPRALYKPSSGDVATARALGLPVFVITPLNIWVATPEGMSFAVVRSRRWVSSTERKCVVALAGKDDAQRRSLEPG